MKDGGIIMRHFGVVPTNNGSIQIKMSFKPNQEKDLMRCLEQLVNTITYKPVKIEATLNKETGSATIIIVPQR